MIRIAKHLVTTVFLLALGGLQGAAAAVTVIPLGNIAPGFVDGDTPALPAVGSAQSGQPSPFNQSIGSDILANEGNFSATWTFMGDSIVGPEIIVAASLSIGIYDHDSAASGDQVATFDIDGSDYTGALNTAFNAKGGNDGQYNVYTISLVPESFTDLADGMVGVLLALQGPGLTTCNLSFACPGEELPFVSESSFNGANLIYSTLTIETTAVPVPAAAPLFLSALVVTGLYRRRFMRG